MSGRRPTGRLHLGHWSGALSQWVAFHRVEAFFEIADLHALTTRYEDPSAIARKHVDMVADWLAAGVDPARSTIYLQSRVPQISELQVLLSMITPVCGSSAFRRIRSKSKRSGADVATYGFFGYPLLQLCDIAIVRADTVPVGKIKCRISNSAARSCAVSTISTVETLVEPQPTLRSFPTCRASTDRKMSKSYGNAIEIADDEATTAKKMKKMFTDPQKLRRGDPGRPEICPVFTLHKLANADRTEAIDRECRSGALGCVACKGEATDAINALLRPVRERRARLDPAAVPAIVQAGSEKARAVARRRSPR